MIQISSTCSRFPRSLELCFFIKRLVPATQTFGLAGGVSMIFEWRDGVRRGKALWRIKAFKGRKGKSFGCVYVELSAVFSLLDGHVELFLIQIKLKLNRAEKGLVKKHWKHGRGAGFWCSERLYFRMFSKSNIIFWRAQRKSLKSSLRKRSKKFDG